MTAELSDATLVPDDGRWTLIFMRELRHPVKTVWAALTDPAEVNEWAPYHPSRDLGATGEAVLTMVDGDEHEDLTSTVRRVDAPRLLEYTWGDDLLRWELEETGTGTRLTLRHTMGTRDEAARNTAGWHVCVDTLEKLLAGNSDGVVRGREALDHGWAELRDGYAAKLGV